MILQLTWRRTWQWQCTGHANVNNFVFLNRYDQLANSTTDLEKQMVAVVSGSGGTSSLLCRAPNFSTSENLTHHSCHYLDSKVSLFGFPVDIPDHLDSKRVRLLHKSWFHIPHSDNHFQTGGGRTQDASQIRLRFSHFTNHAGFCHDKVTSSKATMILISHSEMTKPRASGPRES